MRLYHFTTARYGLEDIRHRRLKVARIGDLNDPYEFLQVASRSPKTRGRYQYLKRSLAEYMGMLCFSESWRNPVQWSHYADRHRGICLGFEITKSEFGFIISSTYRTRCRPADAMQDYGPAAISHMMDLLTLKFRHWDYEQEHRLFVKLEEQDEDSSLYFYDFSTGGQISLREIIVGARSPVSPEEVADALGTLRSTVPARKARLAFRKFEVVRQRDADLWRPTRHRVALREPTLEAAIDRALRREDFSVAYKPSRRRLIHPDKT
jgi:hypothetical protein